MTPPQLSVIIPAYNEEQRITGTLDQILDYVTVRHACEVLVVDDGSRDRTAAVVSRYAERHPHVHLLRQAPNRGKGAAVRHGMLRAGGQFLCFTDADLSTPIETIERMVPLLADGHDVVIASRAVTGSELAVRQNLIRETMGKTFNRMVRAIFGIRYRDTQCGFKGFRREAARGIFSRARVNGFAFDVELVLLAEWLGLSVAEIPIRWTNSQPSRVKLPLHPLQMWWELWAIRQNMRRGVYNLPVGCPP